ncbi:MAG TPA: sugar transferase [Solimonas sp.]|nr:sugar transferase [Solimonas sp.]
MTENRQELAALTARIGRVIETHGPGLPWSRRRVARVAKRLVDLLGAAALLVLAAPVMALTALAVRLTSRGPVLLRQTRLGLNGVPYRMLKFRSMVASQPDGSAGFSGEVTSTDARLTPIGAFIRAWRVDELPQLVHVLAGTMSFVGPRPDISDNVQRYTDGQLLRFAMPPGCTAWTFTRGAFRNDSAARQDINVEYVRTWSFWLDLKIIAGSALVLLRQDEANPSSGAVEPARSSRSGDVL